MIWWLILFGLLAVFLWFLSLVRKYGNPYKTIMVFGKKGSGKTTLLVKLALKHLEKGWTVYSTCPVPGCYRIDASDIGIYQFPPRSCVFVDEVGMIWDNRDFKNFKVSTRDYFKLQRQYKHKVYLFSQTFDVDLKIRNLCDSMYMCFCLGGFFSYAKEIRRKLVVVKPSPDGESRIADELIISPLFLAFFGARICTWIPHWIPYFQTDYMAKPLAYKVFPQVPAVTVEKKTFKTRLQLLISVTRRLPFLIREYLSHQRFLEKWRRNVNRETRSRRRVKK